MRQSQLSIPKTVTIGELRKKKGLIYAKDWVWERKKVIYTQRTKSLVFRSDKFQYIKEVNMPHIVVKLWSGRNDEIKNNLAR